MKFEVDAIDLSSGTFQSLPPLSETREYATSAVVTYKNKQILYVIGGQNKKYLSSVEKFVVIIIFSYQKRVQIFIKCLSIVDGIH